MFWSAVVVGVAVAAGRADLGAVAMVVLDGRVVVGAEGDVAATAVVGAGWAVAWPTVVAAGAGVTAGARRLLTVVVEDGAAVPRTLSSAALVQALPLISDTATKRT